MELTNVFSMRWSGLKTDTEKKPETTKHFCLFSNSMPISNIYNKNLPI